MSKTTATPITDATGAGYRQSRGGRCSHRNRIEVGQTYEGMGRVLVYWCPDCGGLKRTMINWKHTDYRWRLPRRRANDPAHRTPGAETTKGGTTR